MTITSPPYGGTIDYGMDGQIGFGQSHRQYLDDMAALFALLFERTKATGSLWLVVDSFKEPTRSGVSRLVPLPFDLSSLAENAGWVLHDVVIWHKDRTLPWSRRGHLRNAFEYVLFFVKSAQFKYYLERVRTDQDLKEWWVKYPERYSPWGAAPTNVWEYPIPPQGSWTNGHTDHRCPLPQGLVRRMLELTSDEGDLICDPFAGVGTVPAVALAEGRLAVGTELSARYVEQFYSALLPEVLAASSGARGQAASKSYAPAIAALRHAKSPRMLARRLLQSGVPLRAATIHSRVTIPTIEARFEVGSQQIELYVDPGMELSDVVDRATSLLKRPPLSKFGITSTVEAFSVDDWQLPTPTSTWSRLHTDGKPPEPTSSDLHVASLTEAPLLLIDIPAAELHASAQSDRLAVTKSR